jgi:hypothetical protein
MTLQKYSEQGTWKLETLELRDRIGNLKTLSRDNVVALGFPIEFQNYPNSGEAKVNDGMHNID